MSQTTPQPTIPPVRSGDSLDRLFHWLRNLGVRRDATDKWAAGVASGIAHRLGVDPVLIRAAFVVLTCLGGFGVTAYLVAWAFLPNDRNEILAERAIRHGDGWAIVLLVVVAFSVFGAPLASHDNGPFWGAGWLIPVAVIGWIVVRQRQGEPIIPGRIRQAGPQVPGQQPYAAPPSTQSAPNPYAVGTEAAGASTGYLQDAPPAATPPGGGAGGSGWAGPPAPPVYSAPRRPSRRRRSGGFVALLTLGLALAAYGIGLLVRDGVGFPGTGAQLGLVLALASVGVLVTVIGLTGRRGGFSSLVGLALLVVTAFSVVVPRVAFQDGVGDRTWRPIASDSETTYRLGLGGGTLDLSALPTTTTTPAHVVVRQGVGDVRIKVPAGLTARVDAHVGVGDVDVNGNVVLTRHNNSSGSGNTDTYTWTSGTDAPDVIVDARIGLGTITIDQGQ